MRGLGDGGRQRGQHRAGVFVRAQLERDGGADHRVLPVRRHRERAHPFLPVAERRGLEFPRERRRRFLQRLVRADDEVQRLLEHDRPALEQRRERCVGGQPVVQSVGREADVMTAESARLAAFAEAGGGREPQAQRRSSVERHHGAHEHHRAEHAAARTKARREIDDPQRTAVAVVEAGLDDGRVAQVTLLGVREVDEIDGEHALLRIAALLLQQRGEHRVAVRPRQTAPDEAGLLVDQRGDLAIADHAVIHALSMCASCVSHCRTATGPGSHHSDVTRGPTAIARPS